MSQRSQTNDRYRKDADLGSTRKSAASAKPVRRAATIEVGSGKDSGKKKGKDAKGLKGVKGSKATKPKAAPVQMPTSPEIKKWRTVWWILLGAAFVLLAIAWFVPALRTNPTANSVVTIGVFVLCSSGLYIDLVIIRKLRNKIIAEQKNKKPAKVAAKAAGDAAKSPEAAKPTQSADKVGASAEPTAGEPETSIIKESSSPLGGLFKKKKG